MILPNNLDLFYLGQEETEFIYEEIFIEKEYEYLVWEKRSKKNTYVKIYELEDVKNLKLLFIDNMNLAVISTIGDGSCFFHSVLRAFNTDYIKAKSITYRVNMARTFRNALADLLEEIDPLTGRNYYSGLNNGELEKISGGVKEYSLAGLQKELRSSASVDNIYQELISADSTGKYFNLNIRNKYVNECLYKKEMSVG